MVQRHGPFDVVFVPINGAVVEFPHRRPPSPLAAALDPEQAALVGEVLGARIVLPMHYDGYRLDPWYRPVRGAEQSFLKAATGRSYDVRVLKPGHGFQVA
jgi:L-ascorbate metabolism protein UlaG (beta-lactamase superfamily)